jgi:hypothetical protein
VVPGRNHAEREGRIGGCHVVEMRDTSGKGFDRAEGARPRGMVHGAAALPILLVVNVQSDGVGLPEEGEWGSVGQYLAISEETNILPAELHRASPGTS